jgi:hypothetical protein
MKEKTRTKSTDPFPTFRPLTTDIKQLECQIINSEFRLDNPCRLGPQCQGILGGRCPIWSEQNIQVGIETIISMFEQRMVEPTYYPRFSGAANSWPLEYVFCTAGSIQSCFNGSKYFIGNGSPVLSDGRLSTNWIYRLLDDKTAIPCSSRISMIVAIPPVIFSNAIFLYNQLNPGEGCGKTCRKSSISSGVYPLLWINRICFNLLVSPKAS